MTTVLHREVKLNELAKKEASNLYLTLCLPLEVEGENPDANRIRYKNLCSNVEEILAEREVAEDVAGAILSNIKELDPEDVFVPGLQGLAIIVDLDAPSELHLYPLWTAPEMRISLQKNPVTAPILRGNLHHSMLVVCLADNGTRLFRADRGCLKEVMDTDSMPESLAEVIRFEESAGLDGNEHYRNKAGGTDGAHDGRNMNHLESEFQNRYFRLIGEALKEEIKFDEKIVIAAVKEKLDLFRRINPDLPILSEGLSGNWNSAPEPELREAVVELLGRKRQELIDHRLETLAGLSPERKLSTEEDCVKAAKQGRIETLFVDESLLSQDIDDLIFLTAKTKGQIFMVPESSNWDGTLLAATRW